MNDWRTQSKPLKINGNILCTKCTNGKSTAWEVALAMQEYLVKRMTSQARTADQFPSTPPLSNGKHCVELEDSGKGWRLFAVHAEGVVAGKLNCQPPNRPLRWICFVLAYSFTLKYTKLVKHHWKNLKKPCSVLSEIWQKCSVLAVSFNKQYWVENLAVPCKLLSSIRRKLYVVKIL